MIAKQTHKFWAPGHPYYKFSSLSEEKNELKRIKKIKSLQKKIRYAQSLEDQILYVSNLISYERRRSRANCIVVPQELYDIFKETKTYISCK